MVFQFLKIFNLVIVLFLFIPTFAAEDKVPYTIDNDGKVDMYTRVGWKVFHLNYYGCHGIDAVGTDVAPSLVDALKDMSKNEFITKVLTRYRITMSNEAASGDDVTALREAMMSEVAKYERSEKVKSSCLHGLKALTLSLMLMICMLISKRDQMAHWLRVNRIVLILN